MLLNIMNLLNHESFNKSHFTFINGLTNGNLMTINHSFITISIKKNDRNNKQIGTT